MQLSRNYYFVFTNLLKNEADVVCLSKTLEIKTHSLKIPPK